MKCTQAAIAISCLVASAMAQPKYIWAGLPLSGSDPRLWGDGGNPYSSTTSGLPTRVTVGAIGKSTKLVMSGGTADFGSSVTFRGAVTIQLGLGQATTLKLTPTAQQSGRTLSGTFNPVPSTNHGPGSDLAAGFDFTCNLNWRVMNGATITDDIPIQPPCKGVVSLFPQGSKFYYADTYGAVSGSDNINLRSQGASTEINSCSQASNPTSGEFNIGTSATVRLRDCATQFQFAASTLPSSSCAVSIACDDDDYSRVTTDAGKSYRIYHSGFYKGTAYEEIMSGSQVSKLRNATSDLTISGDVGDPDATYEIGGQAIGGDGVAITSTTTTTTTTNTGNQQNARANSQGSGDDSNAGGTTLIIAIVIVAIVVIIAIIAFVVIKKKGGETKGAPREGAVSFENPMYDGDEGVGEAGADGLYSDPVMGDATAGYMDVPADQNSGYMDVPADGSGDGYLDVNPGEEDDNMGAGVSGYMDVDPEEGGDDV